MSKGLRDDGTEALKAGLLFGGAMFLWIICIGAGVALVTWLVRLALGS